MLKTCRITPKKDIFPDGVFPNGVGGCTMYGGTDEDIKSFIAEAKKHFGASNIHIEIDPVI